MTSLYVIYFGLLVFNLIGSIGIDNTKGRTFLVLILGSILTETFASFKGFNDYRLYKWFTPFEFVCVTIILCGHIKTVGVRLFVFLSNIFFLVFCLFEIAANNRDYPSELTAIEDLLLLICCLLAFYYLEPKTDISLFQRSLFWISCGFFVYFMETFTVNTMYNAWLEVDSSASAIHKVTNVIINIISYSLTGYGLLINKWEGRKFFCR